QNAVPLQDSKDPRVLLWVARVYSEAKKYREAEQKLNEAITHANGDPAPWVAKVQFLAMRKRKGDALDVIAQAKKKIARDRAPLALARCYDAIKQPKETQKHYAQALESNPNDAVTVRAVAQAHLAAGRALQAEPLLRRISSGRVRSATADDL